MLLIFFGEHEHWYSLQNYVQFEHLSLCLRSLEEETLSLA